MKHKFTVVAMALLALVLIALNTSIAPASAKPTNTYTIDDGGVMFSSGGSYELSGTIEQCDARTQSGGAYKSNGGFWGFVDSVSKLFLALKNGCSQ